MHWPLVGRDHELAVVEDAVARPSAGVLLVGEAGVGKTRLARAALEGADAHGARTEWVAGATGAAGVPLGAIAHLVPEMDAPENDPGRVFREATRALARPASGQLVLAVDDAHLLDEASAAVLHHAVVAGGASMVCTLRFDEPLSEPIRALVRDAYLDRLDLHPLGHDEVAALLRVTLGSDVADATTRGLAAASQGNPMLLWELVHGGRETGALAEREGLWRWDGPLAAPRLQELVEQRLSRLVPKEREALEMLAVGEPLPLEVFEALVGAETLEALDLHGLVEVSRERAGMVVHVTHPLYGEALRTAVSALRLRRIRRALADAFESAGATTGGDVLRMVVWRLDAEVPVEPAALLTACRRAFVAGDFALAERLAIAAMAVGDDPEARSVLGVALAGQGRIDEAHSLLKGLGPDQAGGTEFPTALTQALDLFFYGSRTSGAAAAVARVKRILAATEDWPADTEPFVDATQAGIHLVTGEIDHAQAAAARTLGHPDASAAARLRALLVGSAAAAMAGRTAEARQQAEQGLELLHSGVEETSRSTDELVDVGAGPLLGAIWFLARRLDGDLEGAHAAAHTRYERALTGGERSEQAMWAFALGQVAFARGAVQTAARHLREALPVFREERPVYLIWCLANLAQAEALCGEVDAAEAVLREAVMIRSPDFQLFDTDLRLAEAWLMATRGDLDAAAHHALDTAHAAFAAGQYALGAVAAHDAARIDTPGAASERLATIAPAVDGKLIPALADHAAAVTARDPRALEGCASRFETMGANLLAAECSAAAARLHHDAGSVLPARTATARARTLADQCEGAVTPGLAALDRTPFLSRREDEIARLAAGGLSNRAIAGQLHVSVRTVDNHLHRAYTKLGVSGREGLAAVLGASQ